MIAKLAKLLAMVICVFLLTGCEIVFSDRALSTTMGYVYKVNILDATHDKDFTINRNISENNSINIDTSTAKKNIIEVSKQCQQINTSTIIMSNLHLSLDEITVSNDSPYLFPKKGSSYVLFNMTILDEPKIVDDNVFVMYSMNIAKYYLLKDALDYQWCQGYINFIKEYDIQINNKYNKIDNAALLYNINSYISVNAKKCGLLNDTQCLAFSYKYNINVINSKTNEVYFNKNLEYVNETMFDFLNLFHYNAFGYYIRPIVRKNREVIEREVFTDELYNALTKSSQNSTTHYYTTY